MKPIVYIVHGIDVEGPMTENLQATFERMRGYGLPSSIPITHDNLSKIQDGRMDGLEVTLAAKLKLIFNRDSLAYLTDWDQIDKAMANVMSDDFRRKHCSKNGEPYLFSWFIYDHHEGFSNNPRYHDVGTHHIFDHYMDGALKDCPFNDGVYWHYHHPAPSGDALESGTCWSNNAVHEEIIAKRIIDRQWYSSCFRAGLHIERNDMSHWLEMFIPFDFSARYVKDNSDYMPGSDFDWRNCSDRWGAWNPDWYDYRLEGGMKRHLFRCTDLSTYLSKLKEDEVEEAFDQAQQYGSSVLTYYNHDYRDMQSEIESGYEVILSVSRRYPEVDFKYVTALEAARLHLNLSAKPPKLSYQLHENKLEVTCASPIFGPQPFLAIKEEGRYFRDNFTAEGNGKWVYQFRRPNFVEAFGIAVNNLNGDFDVVTGTLEGTRNGQ